MNIWNELPKPFFVLAPMDDVTDTVFRRLVADWAAPDLFFTEFASADGLQSPGREAVMRKLQFTKSEHPLIAQIWGKRPEDYRKTAEEIVEMGFDGLDINMGCPVPKIIKNGCCSALINNRELAESLVQEAKAGVGGRISFSVKARLGFDSIDLSWIEFLLRQGLDALIIHGRTTKELSKVPMHWEVFPEIMKLRDKIASETKIVANGDILSRQQGIELAEKYGFDGLMIGRGVFRDPFVFAQHSDWAEMPKADKIAMFRQHVELWSATWPSANPAALRKFCKVYINGFVGSKELRAKIMEQTTINELLDILKA